MDVNPRTELRAFIARYPTQTAAAKALRISPSLLTDVLKRRRGISARVLRRLGLVREMRIIRAIDRHHQ